MVQDRATFRDFGQGPVSKTGNPLDLALQGDGFFVIDTPRGERYTRAGRFSLSSSGQVVDAVGNAVLGTDGRPLDVPAGASGLTVAGDGSLSSDSGPVGKFRVVRFDDPQQMRAEGDSLFTTVEPPRDAVAPGVSQGMVEGANIKAIAEVTAMMAEMREYEFASQFADAEAQREQSAVDKIGRGRG
jgi:flagellar basal-body rod protein FlgF